MAEAILREVVLRDGTRATVSPARPQDRELLRTSYLTLSPESRFHRFLAAVPRLTDAMLDQLVDDVDWIDHAAVLLAVHPEDDPTWAGRKVGVARIIRYDRQPSDADVAVTVLDSWQGRGIATVLLDTLMPLRPRGVTRVVTEVAGDNRAAVAMLSRLGPTTVRPSAAGTLEVLVDLGDQKEDPAAEQ